MKRPHIKNVIFDLDGTLVDAAPLIVKTMQESMRQMHRPEKTEAESRATIGLRPNLSASAKTAWGSSRNG